MVDGAWSDTAESIFPKELSLLTFKLLFVFLWSNTTCLCCHLEEQCHAGTHIAAQLTVLHDASVNLIFEFNNTHVTKWCFICTNQKSCFAILLLQGHPSHLKLVEKYSLLLLNSNISGGHLEGPGRLGAMNVRIYVICQQLS